jgi:hypothetical protein
MCIYQNRQVWWKDYSAVEMRMKKKKNQYTEIVIF